MLKFNMKDEMPLNQAYDIYLKPHQVSIPGEGFERKTLEVLYENIGKPLSKKEINLKIGYTGGDNQSNRGLKRRGWNVISEQKNGELMITLKDLNLHPEFDVNREKRKTQNVGDWEAIKKHYDYRCASCGSLEGEPNFDAKGTNTRLEKGHMDPTKDLTDDNVIPQCQICNKSYKDKFIFDNRGRVVDKNYQSSFWKKSA
jgi:hypothetical protein